MSLEQRQALAMASARMRMGGSAEVAAMPSSDPTDTFGENLAAGAGKAVVDTARGLEQAGPAMENAAPLPLKLPMMLGRAIRERATGRTQDVVQAEVDEAKKLDKPLMETGGGLTGNIGGHVALSLAPGAAASKLKAGKEVVQALLAPSTYKGAAALGAGTGAVEPVASDETREGNMAVNALGGLLGPAIPKVASAILGGNQRQKVQELLSEGVKLTPGQILGGVGQRLEEAATSIPIVGDVIRSSMKKSQESFNTAALNRVLAPIGEKATKIGREGIEEVESKLGAAYDRLLPKLTVKLDQTFQADLQAIKQAAANLPDEQTKILDKVFSNEVMKKFGNGTMTGEGMKKVESELGRLVRGYRGDAAFANRELAASIQDVQSALRSLVTRGNPQHAPELKKVNEGWANFVRVQRASSGVGAADGVFTPSQLSGAVKANDSSLRKGSFARGDALMEDLSDAGVNVMRKNVPDSGTPLRLITGAGVAGGAAMLEPASLAVLGATAGAYTQPAQAVIRAVLARRPDWMKKAGNAVSSNAGALTLPGAAVAQALSQQGGN